MLPHLILGGSMALVGLLLAWWQHAQWADELTLDQEGNGAAARDQYRRRMTMAGMILVVGVAIMAGWLIVDPLWTGLYWLVVLLVVCVTIVLAVRDFYLARDRYLDLNAVLKAEQAKLRKEIRELKAREGNGHG